MSTSSVGVYITRSFPNVHEKTYTGVTIVNLLTIIILPVSMHILLRDDIGSNEV